MVIVLFVCMGILGGIVGEFIVEYWTRRKDRKKDMVFLRQIEVIFPDARAIKSTAVATSDEEAMAQVERELRKKIGDIR